MRVPNELKGARLNIRETAALVGMHEAHFRRLVRRGVFPASKRTSKSRPFYDYGLLVQMAAVMRGRVGLNGEEVMFYSQRRKPTKQVAKSVSEMGDVYLTSLAEGLRQLGIDNADVRPGRLASLLAAEFGEDRPPLEQALPVIARRLLEGQS